MPKCPGAGRPEPRRLGSDVSGVPGPPLARVIKTERGQVGPGRRLLQGLADFGILDPLLRRQELKESLEGYPQVICCRSI